jgi:hypothetical protein
MGAGGWHPEDFAYKLTFKQFNNFIDHPQAYNCCYYLIYLFIFFNYDPFPKIWVEGRVADAQLSLLCQRPCTYVQCFQVQVSLYMMKEAADFPWWDACLPSQYYVWIAPSW